jgi:prepilin-type N-terminal cleavage/methylation domain-containing protein
MRAANGRRPFARRARGMTLIETLIVVVILLGAAAVTLTLLRQQSQDITRASLVALQAREMALIEKAARAYVWKYKATWTVNSFRSIAVSR